jgi:hypothetical protein
MDTYRPNKIKSQKQIQDEVAKSDWTLSYKIKGLTGGALVMFLYTYVHLGVSDPKMIIAGGILGYFLGWVVGSFFYTKK